MQDTFARARTRPMQPPCQAHAHDDRDLVIQTCIQTLAMSLLGSHVVSLFYIDTLFFFLRMVIVKKSGPRFSEYINFCFKA